jgi:hypothetical protein
MVAITIQATAALQGLQHLTCLRAQCCGSCVASAVSQLPRLIFRWSCFARLQCEQICCILAIMAAAPVDERMLLQLRRRRNGLIGIDFVTQGVPRENASCDTR